MKAGSGAVVGDHNIRRFLAAAGQVFGIELHELIASYAVEPGVAGLVEGNEIRKLETGRGDDDRGSKRTPGFELRFGQFVERVVRVRHPQIAVAIECATEDVIES